VPSLVSATLSSRPPLQALQQQANRQFGKLIASHQHRAFGNPPPERLFHPVFPWADA